MKMNLKLTADELMDVVDAAVDAARERDYMIPEEELIEDMTYIVDAALSAMGIEIVPADEDDEDEEEDNDPIADMLYALDDGRTAISFEDACFLMDMIKETGIERGLSEDEAIEAAKTIFMQIGEDYGIETVEEEEEEEEEKKPERVDLDLDKPISQCVFIYEGLRAIKQSDANRIIQAMTKVIEESRLSFLPEEIKQQMRTDMLLKIFEDNGVEIMVKGE